METRPQPCDMRVNLADSFTHVELHGELDLSCEERFAEVVDPIRSDRVVIDLRGLTFIDSSGLRMILRTLERSRREGFELEVVRGSDQVEKIVRVTGLDDVLPMVDGFSPNGGPSG